jgi:hypothetical protein
VVWVQSEHWCHQVMSKNTFKDRGFSDQKLALLASLLEKEGVPFLEQLASALRRSIDSAIQRNKASSSGETAVNALQPRRS